MFEQQGDPPSSALLQSAAGLYQAGTDAQKSPAPVVPFTKGMFVKAAVVIFVALWALLLGDAIRLFQNQNYKYWGGSSEALVVLAAATLALAGLCTGTCAPLQWKSEAPVTTRFAHVTALMLLVLGFMLMYISFPLTRLVIDVRNDILFDCDNSHRTHDLVQHYNFLLALRSAPDCGLLTSVEVCTGFTAVPPYTNYLKTMENSFFCSGFCHQMTAPGLVQVLPPLVHWRRRKFGVQSQLSLESIGQVAARVNTSLESTGQVAARVNTTGNATILQRVGGFPPTLFSDMNWQKSCDGAAVRALQHGAGSFGHQFWYEGIAFVTVALGIGAWVVPETK